MIIVSAEQKRQLVEYYEYLTLRDHVEWAFDHGFIGPATRSQLLTEPARIFDRRRPQAELDAERAEWGPPLET